MDSTTGPWSTPSTWSAHAGYAGAADMMATIPRLPSTFAQYRPELELFYVLVTFAPFLSRTVEYTVPRISRARGQRYLPMLAHIVVVPLLLLRYYARYAALRVPPQPDLADLALGLTFCLSTAVMESYRSRNSSPVIRTGFQAANMIQTALFLAAAWARFDGEDAAPMFRAAIKLFNWFGSFRIAGKFVLPLVDPRLSMGNYVYNIEVNMITSGVFAMWEAGVPAGVPVMLGLISALMVVERDIAERLASYRDDHLLKKLVIRSGFVDFQLLKQKQAAAEAETDKAENLDGEAD